MTCYAQHARSSKIMPGRAGRRRRPRRREFTACRGGGGYPHFLITATSTRNLRQQLRAKQQCQSRTSTTPWSHAHDEFPSHSHHTGRVVDARPVVEKAAVVVERALRRLNPRRNQQRRFQGQRRLLLLPLLRLPNLQPLPNGRRGRCITPTRTPTSTGFETVSPQPPSVWVS